MGQEDVSYTYGSLIPHTRAGQNQSHTARPIYAPATY